MMARSLVNIVQNGNGADEEADGRRCGRETGSRRAIPSRGECGEPQCYVFLTRPQHRPRAGHSRMDRASPRMLNLGLDDGATLSHPIGNARNGAP